MVIAIDDIQVIYKGQGHRTKVKFAKSENMSYVDFAALLHAHKTYLSLTAISGSTKCLLKMLP